MNTRKSSLGLSILAGGLSFVGSASAVDLIIDGSFESSTSTVISDYVRAGGTLGAPADAGWTPFTTYTYSANYTLPGPGGSGQVYLRPYEDDNGDLPVSQVITLSRAITSSQIDSSSGQYNVSAWFSTYLAQNDYSQLTLQFLDVSQQPVGSAIVLGGQAFVAGVPTGAGGLRGWSQDTRMGLIPVGSRYASVSIQSFALVNLPDGYVDVVSLDVTSGFVSSQVTAATPADSATGVTPAVTVSVDITDGSAALNPSSVVMKFDDAVVTPTVNKVGGTTTVQYDPPGLLGSLSSHTYEIAFGASGGGTATRTNRYSFTVAPWYNVNLGAPLHQETFDAVTEGSLPSGWTVQNFTDSDIPVYDLNDFRSEAYLDWVVISKATLSNLFGVIPGGEDFPLTLNVAPNQVINNQVVSNLIDGNFIFAVSDRADNEKQVQYLFTRDYNLSGQNNVYLVFNSIYDQNQDSMGAVEYSTDGGATWLPGIYMLDGPDIVRDSGGGIDASNTFARIDPDGVPDLTAGTLSGGNYGQFIGVQQSKWSTLAPYLSARVNDNHFESKRVEIVRLAEADNKPAVRFRFAQVGTWSWWFGVDNFGLYSIPTVPAPVIVGGPTPATLTIGSGLQAVLSVPAALGVGPITYQWRKNGVNLPGRTSNILLITSAQDSDSGSYDVVISNAGGSVTAGPPAVLTVVTADVLVTGQWDFTDGLKATLGRDLEFFDATVQADTTFGTTTSMGIPGIDGQPTSVMHFIPSTSPWGGYKAYHGAQPNGGGAYVNQYTVVFDVYYPTASDATWRSLWQTATGNGNDGDIFINPGNGLGISGNYQGLGTITSDTWHRIAFSMDLTGPGSPILSKFVDGVLVGVQTGGLSGRDGRFSLDPFALLFADNDGDQAETYVSSVQFSNSRRPDGYLIGLGGPKAAKIPGAITARLDAGNVTVRWTGGVPLESAPSLTGPWTVVTGATSPYPVPAGSGPKFYRPKVF